MSIRAFQAADAAALVELFHASVHQVGALDYSPEQVAAWSPRPADPADFTRRVSDGRDVFVAVNEADEPVAFIELEADGHIDCFYCHPDWVGKGVASSLYDHLERVAISRRLDHLYVEASEAARRLFSRKGYSVEHRRDFERNGVPIHNYRMVKSLA